MHISRENIDCAPQRPMWKTGYLIQIKALGETLQGVFWQLNCCIQIKMSEPRACMLPALEPGCCHLSVLLYLDAPPQLCRQSRTSVESSADESRLRQDTGRL